MKLLDGMTILEFSSRLPGPMAGKILKNLGANVIKVETKQKPDPFGVSEIPGDSTFHHWYESMISEKEHVIIDLENTEDKKKFLEYCDQADGILWSASDKLRNELGVIKSRFERPFVLLELKACATSSSGLHDLNAMALSGILDLHMKHAKEFAPPFVPIAGMLFAEHVATTFLAAFLRAKSESRFVASSCYLLENLASLFDVIWPSALKGKEYNFLHNGKYPCYNIYQTKDAQYIALAAVEEKFWLDFCNKLSIKHLNEKRFDDSGIVTNELRELFSNKTSNEISVIFDDRYEKSYITTFGR